MELIKINQQMKNIMQRINNEKIWKFKEENDLDVACYWSYFWWNKDNDPDDIDHNVRYLQGVDMILAKVDVLDGYFDFISRCHKEYEDSFLLDDLTLSYYLRYKGYKVSSIENYLIKPSEPAYEEQATSKDDGRLTDTVSKGERYYKTFEIINYLKNNHPIK